MAYYRATSQLSPPVRLATGAVRVEARVPSGVQRYGGVAEYVPPEELASAAYMDGLAGLPVLWREGKHPDTAIGTPDEGLVTVDDMGSAVKLGTILGARMDGNDQVVTMVLDHPDGEDIVRQHPYVSMGYRARRVAQAGVAPDGTPYTHIQVARRDPNHVVPTHAPRAGYAAEIRLDAEDDTDTPAQPDGDSTMDEMPPWAKALADAIAALAADIKALKTEETTEAVADTAAPPRMDTIDDIVALQSAAADLGVALDPKATVSDARKAVAAKLVEAHAGVRLDAEADDDARQLAISAYVATRPSQAERIARAGASRLDTTTGDGSKPRLRTQ